MALSKAKITIELREILLKDRPQELYKISKKGTVPVLKVNNLVLDESLDIMLWAIKQSSLNLLDYNKNEQLTMIENNDCEFKQWLDKYKYHDRFPENTIEYYRGKAIETLNIYEGILETNKYFFGDNISLSDIAIFPFIRQFSYVDIDWFNKKYKFLTNWLNLFIESDLFKSVMGKYQIWDSSLNRIIVNFKYDEKPNIK
tara:strand:+ start:627 stop:1226 length:600 start_codon:yes stop_codon:yes gene_type:complete